MSDTINYGQLMHQAMRGLIAQVLSDVARDGLPGEHHFFITFTTNHPGVDLPDWLRERYPDEMTIVMQEWFKDLTVDDQAFSVTLNFGNQEVPMTIPLDAILTFVDPSVEFGLRFEAAEGENPEPEESPMIEIYDDTDDDAKEGDAEVVSLDSFRK
ncbi:MAG: ClpXP protease specificity-enhancing factor SspB [Paracoccaceae bacterium]|nr:ClpXP protease specificity-enhancing factor SspB [Paracoccaceae bacterium]